MWIGCHADSQEYARWFGDDIAVRRDAYLVDWSGLPYLRFLLGNVARGEPLAQRVRVMATLMRDARGQLAHADPLPLHVGGRAGPAPRSSSAGRRAHAGVHVRALRRRRAARPARPATSIPIEMRVAQLADVAEVHHRMYGVEGAVAMARSRRGGHLDPAVVDAFTADAEALFPAPGDDPWDRARRIAPDVDDPAGRRPARRPARPRSATSSTSSARSRSATRGTWRRSRRPPPPARASSPADVGAVRRAGLPPRRRPDRRLEPGVVEAGRLTRAEWERVRMHPYLTDRVLTRIPGLAPGRRDRPRPP